MGLGRAVQPSHESALEGDAIGVIEPVEDGVAEGRVSDEILSVLDGELAGEEGATESVAVVTDFEEVVAGLA